MRDDTHADALDLSPAADRSKTPPVADQPTRHPASDLRFVCVEYDDSPDRCTIHPRGATRETLMATWLTADRDASVDLAATR